MSQTFRTKIQFTAIDSEIDTSSQITSLSRNTIGPAETYSIKTVLTTNNNVI